MSSKAFQENTSFFYLQSERWNFVRRHFSYPTTPLCTVTEQYYTSLNGLNAEAVIYWVVNQLIVSHYKQSLTKRFNAVN